MKCDKCKKQIKESYTIHLMIIKQYVKSVLKKRYINKEKR